VNLICGGVHNKNMPSTQEFRRRIKSVNSTRQITRAMEMVASVKMQKAVRAMQSTRSYIQTSWNLLELLGRVTSPDSHPLLNQRKAQKTGLITITSDRGLCGSYNTNIINKANSYAAGNVKIGEQAEIADNIDLVSIGQKGSGQVAKLSKSNLIAQFEGFGKEIDFEDILPVSKLMIDSYLEGRYDKVVLIYSHFESTLKQTPVAKQILPITRDHIDIPSLWEKPSENFNNVEFKFEPSPDAVLDRILIQFIKMQIYGALLEANASEHSARMFAMKNASDNAKDLINDLTLTYNTIRQDGITREIAEISGAAEAMS
jgi:F-type H+-transporting ATPase subunit gamma